MDSLYLLCRCSYFTRSPIVKLCTGQSTVPHDGCLELTYASLIHILGLWFLDQGVTALQFIGMSFDQVDSQN